MKFKPLKWIERDCWVAYTPASEFSYISIYYEEGLYWASWDLTLPGTTNIESLKQTAQAWHEEWLMEYIEQE